MYCILSSVLHRKINSRNSVEIGPKNPKNDNLMFKEKKTLKPSVMRLFYLFHF